MMVSLTPLLSPSVRRSLCNGNAFPGWQNGASCAAVVRSKDVFSTVAFSASDAVMPYSGSNGGKSSPPPNNLPVSCTSGAEPLSRACVRVLSATYNHLASSSPSTSPSTVVDFNVVNYGGCSSDEAFMSFQVLLQPAVATQLQSSSSIVPQSASFGR